MTRPSRSDMNEAPAMPAAAGSTPDENAVVDPDAAPVVSPDAGGDVESTSTSTFSSGAARAGSAGEPAGPLPSALPALVGLALIWAALYVVAVAEGISSQREPDQPPPAAFIPDADAEFIPDSASELPPSAPVE